MYIFMMYSTYFHKAALIMLSTVYILRSYYCVTCLFSQFLVPEYFLQQKAESMQDIIEFFLTSKLVRTVRNMPFPTI